MEKEVGNNLVRVLLWGHTVGYLWWDKRKGVAQFEYEPSFLSLGWDIAPLTMPIDSPRTRAGIPWEGDTEKLYKGLPPCFADSLPDQWGQSLYRAWLRDNGVSTRKASPIHQLCFIGSRAMGALEYEPALPLGPNVSEPIDVQALYGFAQQVLSERTSTQLDAQNSLLWRDLIKVSSSVGGRRPKAIVAIHRETGVVVSGQSQVGEGFEHFVLKYDDGLSYPFARLEYVYYQMAQAAGIEMMPSQLRSYGEVQHFLTRRFDRVGNEKLHCQTLAALWPLSTSHEDSFSVLRRLQLPQADWVQHYLRVVFNVLACNVDDHSKNFSFCMNRTGRWRLSPAYDITFSMDLDAPAYMNKHSLSLNDKNSHHQLSDLLKLAQENDIENAASLIEQVRRAVSQFRHLAHEQGIDAGLVERIAAFFPAI